LAAQIAAEEREKRARERNGAEKEGEISFAQEQAKIKLDCL